MRVHIVLVVVFFLVACQQEPSDPAVLPVPDVKEVEIVEVTEVVEEITERFTDEVEEVIEELEESTTIFEHSFDGAISFVICDRDARKLTFTFSNPTDLTWQLDRDLPWPSPQGITVVDIILNDLQVNDPFDVLFNDELMYGPNKKFSENCDGDAELAPGEEITCTVWPVPINQEKFGDVTNFLIVFATRLNERVQFSC